ncbi:polymorphic toxin type 17 domain-containing protein [Candidatus Dependentiae bacterium]
MGGLQEVYAEIKNNPGSFGTQVAIVGGTNLALGFCCAPVKIALLIPTAVSALTEGHKLYGQLQKLPFQERVETVVKIIVRDVVRGLCLQAGLKVNSKIAALTKKAISGILANNKLAENFVNKASTAVKLLQKNSKDLVKGKIKQFAQKQIKVAKNKNFGKNIVNKSVKNLIKSKRLPTQGRIRYVPPKGFKPNEKLPVSKIGGRPAYVDRFNNLWVKGPSRTKGEPFEWDVQLSSQGKAQLGWLSKDGDCGHINVSLKGEITH